MQSTLEKWSWKELDEARFQTPEGIIDLTRDTKATIEDAAEAGWFRDMLAKDNRGGMVVNGADASLTHELVLGHHQSLAAGKSMAERMMAVGSTFDYRTMYKRGEAAVCHLCGDAEPSRRHWLWDCTGCLPNRPESDVEAGLCVPLVPKMKWKIDRKKDKENVKEAEENCKQMPLAGKDILVGTDGGFEKPLAVAAAAFFEMKDDNVAVHMQAWHPMISQISS